MLVVVLMVLVVAVVVLVLVVGAVVLVTAVTWYILLDIRTRHKYSIVGVNGRECT